MAPKCVFAIWTKTQQSHIGADVHKDIMVKRPYIHPQLDEANGRHTLGPSCLCKGWGWLRDVVNKSFFDG